MFLTTCILVQLKYQPNNVLIKIQFLIDIKLLHVSVPECRPQEILILEARNIILIGNTLINVLGLYFHVLKTP